MAPFEHKPLAVRKRIALFWTIAVGVVLVALMIVIRTRPQVKESDYALKLKEFYTTVVESGQSYFSGK
jgi:hypothetical protein